MPAPTAAPAPSPAPSPAPRSAAAGARAEGAGNDQFGRQLDAARQQQTTADDSAGAAAAADKSAAATAQAAPESRTAPAAAVAVDGQTADTDSVEPAGKAADDGDDAPASGIAPFMLTLLLPGAITPLAHKAGAAHALPSAIAGQAGKNPALAALQAAVLANPQAADPLTTSVATDGLAQAPAALAQILAGAKPGLREALATDDATAAVAAPPPPQGAAPSVPQVQVLAPAGTPAFATELNQQITWFATQDVKQARIRLHPEELGMLDLKISVQHGHVDVAITAQHPGAVLALQQSLPQLDQMLAQQGLALGHSEVSQHGREEASGQGRGKGGDRGGAIDEVAGVGAVAVTRSSLNLLDAFA